MGIDFKDGHEERHLAPQWKIDHVRKNPVKIEPKDEINSEIKMQRSKEGLDDGKMHLQKPASVGDCLLGGRWSCNHLQWMRRMLLGGCTCHVL